MSMQFSEEAAEPDAGVPQKRSYLKYLGIGCGIVMLLGAVLLAVGAFRAATCCSRLIDYGQRTEDAVNVAYQFGLLLHENSLDEAYILAGEDYQERVSQEYFDASVAPYASQIQSFRPYLYNLNINIGEHALEGVTPESRWDIFLGYAEPSSTQILLMRVRIVPEVGEQALGLVIQEFEFELVKRRLANEAPAREVLTLYHLMREQRHDEVVQRLEPAFAEGRSPEALAVLSREHGEVVSKNREEVIRVEYIDRTHARVRVRLHSLEDETSREFAYDLKAINYGFSWRVISLPEHVEN